MSLEYCFYCGTYVETPCDVAPSDFCENHLNERGKLMLKQAELITPTSCLNKAAADEPIFVLRAKDIAAPMTLRHWAAMSNGIHEKSKIEEALRLATEMEDWHARNVPGVSL
jgi:hypothetical protein